MEDERDATEDASETGTETPNDQTPTRFADWTDLEIAEAATASMNRRSELNAEIEEMKSNESEMAIEMHRRMKQRGMKVANFGDGLKVARIKSRTVIDCKAADMPIVARWLIENGALGAFKAAGGSLKVSAIQELAQRGDFPMECRLKEIEELQFCAK